VLARLHIHNLAVVDEVELDFDAGFTTLTGETGAGKSILVDALALALGERADSRAIRAGADRCEITATFDVGGRPDLVRWLTDNDLDEDAECILRRVVTAEGRSRGYVNGRAVPLQNLRELGSKLVDICGQQSHQSLRHPKVQRDIVDQFGGHEKLLATMKAAHERWQATQSELDTLTRAQQDRTEKQELLSYQVNELTALNLQEREVEELEAKHLRVANTGHITDTVSSALERLYEADANSAHATISTAKHQLDELTALDAGLQPVAALLNEAEILISEAAEALRQYLGGLEHDPQEQMALEQRIAGVHELARKHRVDPAELPDLLGRLDQELTALQNSDERLTALANQADQLEDHMISTAQKLTRARQKAGKSLGQQVTDNMRKLGMPDGRFQIELQPKTAGQITPSGAERIDFTVTVNAGQKAGPLAQVASGGELSRLTLSIQVVAIAADSVPTLIFDEVDSGVGGGVAEIVGNRLCDLSRQRQVLCVTHLPQVASQADNHLRVTKITDGVSTRTTVKALTTPERTEEIARMLGGVEITDRTRAHAAEMLKQTKLRSTG
jgi:DNA repair protein RecN (Recombination protein N)